MDFGNKTECNYEIMGIRERAILITKFQRMAGKFEENSADNKIRNRSSPWGFWKCDFGNKIAYKEEKWKWDSGFWEQN